MGKGSYNLQKEKTAYGQRWISTLITKAVQIKERLFSDLSHKVYLTVSDSLAPSAWDRQIFLRILFLCPFSP